jgi:hypothetical protein
VVHCRVKLGFYELIIWKNQKKREEILSKK